MVGHSEIPDKDDWTEDDVRLTESLLAGLAQDGDDPNKVDARFEAQAGNIGEDDYFDIPGSGGPSDPDEEDEDW